MGFWDNVKDSAARMNAGVKTRVGQFKNATFAEGTMAMCALIAAADGTIDRTERAKTAGFIASSDTLSVFDVADLQAKFSLYCDKLTQDYDFGKIAALQAVGKLKSKPDQARVAIQVGIIIGSADGNFDDDEKKMVREACFALGLPPAEFDL